MAFDKFAPVTPANPMPVSFGAATAVPLTLYAKSVTVLTAGAPADIATITIPAGVTRWAVVATSDIDLNPRWLGGVGIVETAAATLQDAVFVFRTAAGGGGIELGSLFTALTTVGTSDVIMSFSATVATSSASTITVRQTIASANAGTVSFYITIFPLP